MLYGRYQHIVREPFRARERGRVPKGSAQRRLLSIMDSWVCLRGCAWAFGHFGLCARRDNAIFTVETLVSILRSVHVGADVPDTVARR